MLDSLRNFGSSWFGKIVLGFLLIGLAGFGISGVITGLGSTRVAKVGNEDISIQEFQRAYNVQLNAVAAQTGSIPTPEQALMFGLPGVTIDRLASEKALSIFGEGLGLGASDTQLGKLLREDPSFGGVLGQFDRANFQGALRQNGITESDYLRSLKQAAQRQQIAQSVFANINAPQTSLEIVNRFQNDLRTVEYFTLSPLAALPPADPNEAELQAYLVENQFQFRTIPKRTASIVILTPNALEVSVEVSEAEIAAEYERSRLSLTKIATRDIHQVILSTDAQKSLFEAGVVRGADFDTLVAEAGLTPTNLGSLSQSAIADTNLAEAAFALEEGEIALVPGALGTRAVSISNIVAGGQLTLEEARDQLDQKIRTTKSRSEYIEILDQIEELRATFQPLDQIATRYKLKLSEVTLTATGAELAAVDDLPEESRGRVANAIFAQNIDSLAPGITIGANMNVWFDLSLVEEARDQTLDEVRSQIQQIILDQRIDDVLAADAERALTQLASGTPLQMIAAERALFAEISSPITRNGDGVLNAVIAAEIFNGGPRHFGTIRGDSGDYIVFQVIDLTIVATQNTEQVNQFVTESARDDVFNAFSTALRDDAGVSVSQQILTQAIGLNAGTHGR